MRDEEENQVIRPAVGLVQPLDLTPLSVSALKDYIGALNTEIGRVEAAIRHKDAARGHADGFFKKAP